MFNLNARLVNELPEGLALVQRGLFYADALFESIRVLGGRIPLLRPHWERLLRGMRLMHYQIPPHWSAEYFEKEILKSVSVNARVRLTVWRSPGGLYLPENDAPQFLITSQAMESDVFSWHDEGIRTGLCESVRLPVDSLSGVKTLNAARYVAAAREAQERGWDEGILLNASGRICEATSSNVFWFENGCLYTPPLSDGCVTGVLRDLLLALTKAAGSPICEKTAVFDDILAADEVFLTNAVRGIRWVRYCEGKVFGNAETRKLHELMVAHIADGTAF